jgi:hypothetical protein
LDHSIPQNVNSAYAKSAHIPLAKETARKAQRRRTSSFTKPAGHWYVKNLVISHVSSDSNLVNWQMWQQYALLMLDH